MNIKEIKELIKYKSRLLYPTGVDSNDDWPEGYSRNEVAELKQQAFTQGANFALEMEMWVKCSAQMPYDTDYVLVTDGVYIDVMHYNVHKRVWGSDVITPTHWQPLPKLPQ